MVSNWLATPDGFLSNDANAWHVVDVSWSIVGVGDFNRDGLGDILWRHSSGALSNWLGTPSGGFTPNDANAWNNVELAWEVSSTGDFNGDGFSDILWRHTDGTVGNWLGSATGGFTVNNGSLQSATNDWHIIGTGDFNGDAFSDILWRNDSGAISTWLGTRSGTFVVNDVNAWHQVPQDWHVADIADYNGDGRDDILWRSDNNLIGNWLGTPAGGFFNNEVNSLTIVDSNWRVIAPDIHWL